jgi:hypothetical protein
MSGPFTRRGEGWRKIPKCMTTLCVAMALPFLASPAQAAGTAYAVDTSEVTDTGACKIESWFSKASNHDFFGAVNPACGVNLFLPAELSAQVSRARSDGDWTTGLAPKAKVRIIPTAIGTPGLAVSATAGFDLTHHENTWLAVTAPVTLRLSNVVRINLNGGWMWDRTVDRHFLTYGAGVDWRTADNVYTLTAEVFGQLGSSEVSSITQPRFQLGMRFRPIDAFSVDIIYGRNIMGENANWITAGTTIRFAAE